MKHSLVLLISTTLFLVLDIIVFVSYKKSIEESFEHEIDIAFWRIQAKSSELLSDLLHNYSKQVELIRKKHRYIKRIIEHSDTDPLKLDLQPLFRKINENLSPPRYNIYITDKSLVIKNSTFKNDIGFDLSFAKTIFDKHFKEKTIGVNTPLLEKTSKNFISYSDSYYSYKGDPKRGILQLSYTYFDVTPRLEELRKTIRQSRSIRLVKAYTKLNDGFIVDIKFNDPQGYKPKLNEILATKHEGEDIETLLKNKGFKRIDQQNSIYYFFSSYSPIDPHMIILYHIEFSKEALKAQLFNLYRIMIVATLLGLFILYVLVKLFQKEQRLAWQDLFIQSSMHQLKTPLTLIRINNEMLQIECPANHYSKNIEAGIKTLQNSFDDMHFVFKNEKTFPIEHLSLQKILKERIEYFNTIAKAYEKKLQCECKNDVTIEISQEELVRLIDNNLSNAIKYAKPGSTIKVTLKNSTLSFQTKSNAIKEKKRIFEKYYREDNTQGGHGLGLFIVSMVAKKYNIEIQIDSNDNETIFTYTFKETSQ